MYKIERIYSYINKNNKLNLHGIVFRSITELRRDYGIHISRLANFIEFNSSAGLQFGWYLNVNSWMAYFQDIDDKIT